MPLEIQKTIEEILKNIVSGLKVTATLNIKKEADQYRIIIQTDEPETLTEKNGELVNQIQHILRVAIHQKFPSDKTHFLLDINDYRKNREYNIKIKIPDIARVKVLQQGKIVIFIGLSSYERMLIHQILSDSKGLNTSSVGPDEARKLLIMPTSEFGSSSIDDALIIDVNKL